MSPTDAVAIIGRSVELARLRAILDELPSGPLAALLEGPPGIGKTALWREAVAEATSRDYRVLASHPAQPDAELSFATLGDLLETVDLDDLAGVPEPQRRALDVALRRELANDDPVDPLALGIGLRGALRELARVGPVVIAIDDLHWVDPASASALDFACRRLEAEPIGVVGTIRSDAEAPGGWPVGAFPVAKLNRIAVEGLPPEEFARVVRSALETELPRELLGRIYRTSAGNPLHGAELSRALLDAEVLPGPEEPLPVPTDLHELLEDRLRGLPDDARDILAVAALVSEPTIDLLHRVGRTPDAVDAALLAASERGAIKAERGRIRFTHPMLVAVVASDLAPEDRRRIHRLLAGEDLETEERARHRALGSEGPDEETAAAVEEAARSVRLRGAPAAAAELCEQACRLTPSDRKDDARRRVIAAAEYHLDGGNTRRARELLEELTAELPPGRARAVAVQRLGWVRYHDDSWTAAARLFEEARADAADDSGLEASISLDASLASLLGGDVRTASDDVHRALEQARSGGDDSLIAEASAVAASIDFLSGSGVPGEVMDRALAMETWRQPRPTLKQPSVALGILLKWSDDYERGRALLSRAHRKMIETGNERSLPFILFHLAELDCWAGDWGAAEEHAEQGLGIASDMRQDVGRAFCFYARALVHALRGRLDDARSDAQAGLAHADRSGAVPAGVLNHSVLGFVELSTGEMGRAADHLVPLADDVTEVGIYEPGVLRYSATRSRRSSP
jgi:tetratricopeptide (TPR) repeat protein